MIESFHAWRWHYGPYTASQYPGWYYFLCFSKGVDLKSIMQLVVPIGQIEARNNETKQISLKRIENDAKLAIAKKSKRLEKRETTEK